MKIGILQTGSTPDELKPVHGDYDDFFKNLLVGRDFEFATYHVLDGDLPDSIVSMEGWLVTGSKFAVYKDHPWIPPLETFLRSAYASGVPIFGVCFGHQIFAQALGGRVEKFYGGWSVGPKTYRTRDGSKETFIAWHQDQVTEKPDDAVIVSSSEFCRCAILAYGETALTIQPHPEFTPEFMAELIDARRDVLPDDIIDVALATINEPLTSQNYANQIEKFFKMPRVNG